MHKKFSYILIPIISLGILLAPISPIFQNNAGNLSANIETNKAEAASITDLMSTSTITVDTVNSNSAHVEATLTLNQKYSQTANDGSTTTTPITLSFYDHINGEDPSYGIYLILKNKATGEEIQKSLNDLNASFDVSKTQNVIDINTGPILNPNTQYSVRIHIDANFPWSGWDSPETAFQTLPYNAADPTNTATTATTNSSGTGSGYKLGCALFTTNQPYGLIGCVAALFYTAWEVSAWIGHLAGSFLDFFIYYSTNSASYTNTFINKAFGAVRDIANIFFIIALLYVAIKTILDLNVTNNKKLIGTIVIVALLINFSLFTTELIIDGTNILAKVFYNQITSQDENGKLLPAGAGGQTSISIGLVNKFDPQGIVSWTDYNANQGTYIFITILAIVVTLYTAFIFFSVALLFVGRVVALWLSMIFAPIAFASYTMPINIPGLGHKDWWDELLKNAFLAPIFIFFLFIIVMFADFLKTIVVYPSNPDQMQKIMAIVIPFAILIILLMKAKEMAVKLSGEIGKAIMSGAKTVTGFVGGAAVGVVAGGAAIAGRATIGRAGAAISRSETLKSLEGKGVFGVKTLRNVGTAAGKGSMDIRGVKVAGKSLESTGLKVNTISKPKEGGFEKMRADKTEKRQRRAKDLEAGPDSKLVANVRSVETSHQNLVGKYANEIEKLDKTIEKKRQAMNDARTTSLANPNEETKEAFKKATNEFNASVAQKKSLKKGEDKDYEVKDSNGVVTGTVNYKDAKAKMDVKDANGKVVGTTEKSMAELEDDELPKVKNDLRRHNFQARQEYVKTLGSGWNKFANAITSMGQHSYKGLDESIHNIRMDTKLDSGAKTH